MQLLSEVAVVSGGRLVAVTDVRGFAPRLAAARPVAILAQHAQHAGQEQQGEEGAAEDGQASPTASSSEAAEGEGEEEESCPEDGMVVLWGYGISAAGVVVICRQGGESAQRRHQACMLRLCASCAQRAGLAAGCSSCSCGGSLAALDGLLSSSSACFL